MNLRRKRAHSRGFKLAFLTWLRVIQFHRMIRDVMIKVGRSHQIQSGPRGAYDQSCCNHLYCCAKHIFQVSRYSIFPDAQFISGTFRIAVTEKNAKNLKNNITLYRESSFMKYKVAKVHIAGPDAIVMRTATQSRGPGFLLLFRPNRRPAKAK